ncbi:MAG: alpha/beta fold hydrolase [Piscinibacter sp.]|uniref:alpha/beta fold hydrolase n=1 Tax=Piscinibacter TaxID=1114981 RepID=UPI000FDDF65E|nr:MULTISPECIES: alpha/beta fold hydrolase [Piscinibacter]MCW5666412.1 alpha/beta fold hydrolase [Piscinibacter sp.]
MPHAPLALAFETTGGGGPPVLLLHGLFASAAHWGHVAAALAQTHRVYAVDLRNHGASPRSADMSYLAMADDVLHLIEREGLDRPAVIGHSMGGNVAMALALTAPWSVGRLAVIDIAPVTYANRWANDLQRAMGALLGAPDAGAAAVLAGLGHWMIPRSPAGYAQFDWRTNLAAVAVSLHELCDFPRHLRHLGTALPLLAIAGGRSDRVVPLGAAAYRPMFPNARLEVIDAAGHWVHADCPSALLGSLRRFLAARPQAAALAA